MDIITLSTLILSVLIIVGVVGVVFKLFENSKPSVEYIVLLAMLVAVAVVGKLIGLALPSIQAASFIIIMAGVVFGKETGFLVGVLTSIVSDLVFGLGYWTLFKIIAWGLMGFTAGMVSSKMDNLPFRAGFGFIWGILYGWITNLSMIIFLSEVNLNALIGLYVSSITLDVIHGAVNAILLIIAYTWFKKIFLRSKDRYLGDGSTS
ncbi:MAG: ECF transporter S component [Methanobacteriaceae archaeon]|nr:ECF transporter S component [Methanobacteriaceae archaeon]